MAKCLFCGIVEGTIPSSKVYEDEMCVAFNDINPQAECHVLLIPKTHIASLDATDENNAALLGHLMLCAAKIARELGISESGYRVVSNIGENGRQSVRHLHLHIIGGQTLSESLC